jgi:hypothetical protein
MLLLLFLFIFLQTLHKLLDCVSNFCAFLSGQLAENSDKVIYGSENLGLMYARWHKLNCALYNETKDSVSNSQSKQNKTKQNLRP